MILLLPCLLVPIIYLTHRRLKQNQSPVVYICLFIVIILIQLMCSIHASERFVPDASMEIRLMKMVKKLSERDRRYYEEKRNFHLDNGKRCFNDAKQKCWYLPSYEDRKIAQDCLTTAIGAISSGTPQSKAVAMLAIALTNYGLSVLDEWNYIENKLNWAKYHFEMYDWYVNVLQKS